LHAISGTFEEKPVVIQHVVNLKKKLMRPVISKRLNAEMALFKRNSVGLQLHPEVQNTPPFGPLEIGPFQSGRLSNQGGQFSVTSVLKEKFG
jgi:hypothetical protein